MPLSIEGIKTRQRIYVDLKKKIGRVESTLNPRHFMDCPKANVGVDLLDFQEDTKVVEAIALASDVNEHSFYQEKGCPNRSTHTWSVFLDPCNACIRDGTNTHVTAFPLLSPFLLCLVSSVIRWLTVVCPSLPWWDGFSSSDGFVVVPLNPCIPSRPLRTKSVRGSPPPPVKPPCPIRGSSALTERTWALVEAGSLVDISQHWRRTARARKHGAERALSIGHDAVRASLEVQDRLEILREWRDTAGEQPLVHLGATCRVRGAKHGRKPVANGRKRKRELDEGAVGVQDAEEAGTERDFGDGDHRCNQHGRPRGPFERSATSYQQSNFVPIELLRRIAPNHALRTGALVVEEDHVAEVHGHVLVHVEIIRPGRAVPSTHVGRGGVHAAWDRKSSMAHIPAKDPRSGRSSLGEMGAVVFNAPRLVPRRYVPRAYETAKLCAQALFFFHKGRVGISLPDPTGSSILELFSRARCIWKHRASTPVAVKVRHPGVEKKIRTDFEVMQTLAFISSKIPGLASMRLEESIRQFAMPLFEQVDLELEAEHLRRFIYNFRKMRGVSFPEPIYPLVSPSVLVETYEEGESMAHYLEMLNQEIDPKKLEVNGVQKSDMFKPLAILGCKTLLQMMLRDNFVHADLHPGNILVRIDKPEKPWDVMLNQFVTGDTSPRPHVVLLDVGMTAELSNKDQINLHGFFESVLELDGESAAKYILAMSPWQGCPDPEGFKNEVGTLFKSFDNMMSSGVTDVSLCMNTVLDSVRKYQVNIQGNILSVVVTTLVLEGWATKLDPDVSIISTIRQTLAFKDPIHWVKKSFERTADMLLSPTYRELMSEYMLSHNGETNKLHFRDKPALHRSSHACPKPWKANAGATNGVANATNILLFSWRAA
eukprot:scaffold741_cov336-Pavlova_lutheri.AAC.62